jgi:hypothetical protein
MCSASSLLALVFVAVILLLKLLEGGLYFIMITLDLFQHMSRSVSRLN